MKSGSLNTILMEMDALKENFTKCRAYFPYMTEKSIGAQSIKTAPFYSNKGFNITFSFSEPLTGEHIQKNNEIAHWTNQNFIVRLCATLESYDILSEKISIDKSIDGWKELDLLRRLRHVFAHTSGKCNPEDEDHRKLREELISRFKLDIKDMNPQKFPLDIDKVIYPLFEDCKKYVQGKIRT